MIEIEVYGVVAPETALRVVIRNVTKEKFVAFEHSLPWKSPYSMIVAAVETDPAGTALKRTLPIDDPGPGTASIEPEEMLSGEISLVQRFPSFTQVLREKDVFVFWAYRLQPIGSAPLPWASGHVIFARDPEKPN